MKKYFFITICILSIFKQEIHAQDISNSLDCTVKGTPTVLDYLPPKYIGPEAPPEGNPNPSEGEPPNIYVENAGGKVELRPILFVHGLAGSPIAWVRVADATDFSGSTVAGYPQRQAFCHRASSYNQQKNLSTAASEVYENFTEVLESRSVPQKQRPLSIAIGSSQGGLVLRSIDYENKFGNPYSNPSGEQIFGGIVTFGSPNQGAAIINNAQKVLDLGEEGFTELGAAPLTTFMIVPIFIKDLLGIKSYKDIKGWVKTSLQDIKTSRLLPISEDFKVGAPYLNQLNNYNSNVYKVAMYGTETQGSELWREVYSLAIKEPNNFLAFEADNDGALKDAMSNVRAFYNFMANMSLGGLRAGLMYPRWKRGVHYLDGINGKWINIIGAGVTYASIPTGNCVCEKYDASGGFDGTFTTPGPNCSQPNDTYTNCSDEYYIQTISQTNDGVVPESSQKGFSGAKQVELPGSNHQQMRNDSNTKAQLNNLFNGGHGSFFFTKPK